MKIDGTDFGSFTLGQRIRHFEVEGFTVLPETLAVDDMERIKAEMAEMPMIGRDYSADQTESESPPQWYSGAVAELVGHPATIELLTALMGDDILFTMGVFQRTHPGAPGISMHTDGQPYGSSIFDYEGSSPRLLRVIYYLDDLPPKRSPFRLVPRSHLSFHADANPYLRYESHPDEITLCLKAGSALIFPKDLFHGTHPNVDRATRSMVQFGYRPGWAGPIQPVEEWDHALVASAPEAAKPFLQSRNKTGSQWQLENKPKNMPTTAPGIDPGRWDL